MLRLGTKKPYNLTEYVFAHELKLLVPGVNVQIGYCEDNFKLKEMKK